MVTKIRKVNIKLTDPDSLDNVVLSVNLDFKDRTEPEVKHYNGKKGLYKLHTWKRKDGSVEIYNSLLGEALKNGLNNQLIEELNNEC